MASRREGHTRTGNAPSRGASRRPDSGRVVVVGDAALADQLDDAVARAATAPSPLQQYEVVRVDHYLAAMGEIAGSPTDAVVGRLRPMRSSIEATVRALRALGGQAVRLLLVVDAEEEPEAMRAVRLGFDDYLVEPVKLADLLGAISQDAAAHVAAASEPPSTVDGDAVWASGGEGMAGTAATADAPIDPIAGWGPDDLKAWALDNHGDAAGGAAGAAAALGQGMGDTDLVEQLLRDRNGLREAAVAKLRHRLADPNLRFSEQVASRAHACVPVRGGRDGDTLCGHLVSDVTDAAVLEQHAAWLGRWLTLRDRLGELNDMAMRDGLTGVWNRRYFERVIGSLIDRARAERFRVTVMLFDIDDFKTYNDRYGHAAGDEILAEAARLMQAVVRQHDIVARIGGDEFAVIFWDAEPPRRPNGEAGACDHPQSVRRAAERFQQAVCEHRFPKLAEEAPATLTISGGLASFPWDGTTAEQLVEVADRMMLESKRQGKNAITFGPGSLRLCGLEEA